MEITIRIVHELSPALEALVRRLIGGAAVKESLTTAAAATAADAPAGQSSPARKKPGPTGGYRTPERLAVLERDWPGGRPAREILAEMNAQAGVPVPSIAALSTWAAQIGVKRPGEWIQGAAIAAGQRAARQAREIAAQTTYDTAVAWAATVDPDMVLRGDTAARMAQINELRVLEGQKPFRMDVAA